MRIKSKNRPKPEIVNFRIKWDKVADLVVNIAVAVVMLWVMIFASIALYLNF